MIEKVNSMIEVGDCTEDIETAIKDEEAKLQVVIEESKEEYVKTPDVISGSVSFYDKLQWSIKTQVNDIKKAITESSTDDSKVVQKIDIDAAKVQFNKTTSVELSKVKTEIYKETGTTESEVSVIITKPVTKTQVIYESIEQAETETRKTLLCTVDHTKSRFVGWYDILFGRLKAITYVSGESYETEVQKIIACSLEEAKLIIKESKESIDFNYTVTEESSDISTTVKNTQQHAIESLDTIYTIVSEQVSVIEHVIKTSEVELIEEKFCVIQEQAKHKTCAAIEATAECAIACGFQGKTMTWVETAQIPNSFKGVKVFAFDLIDSVVNYRASVAKAWYAIVTMKDSFTFAHVDVQKLIVRWYNLYLEYRLKAKHSESDLSILLITFRLILVEFGIEGAFTEAEILALCGAWTKLELFEDASASIRKIKQLDGVYAVAISHAFTIRTMMDLARAGCLCWHAQFTADMFAACTINNGTPEEVTVVTNTAMLLGLNDASELAVVSSNPKILAAAKDYGSKTVMINRYSQSAAGAVGAAAGGYATHEEFDLEFSALDIFSESFESFYQTKVYYTKVEVPVTRSWFQRVISTVAETVETVTETIIG